MTTLISMSELENKKDSSNSENKTNEHIDSDTTTENIIHETTTINSKTNEYMNNVTENNYDYTTEAIEYTTNLVTEESATTLDESSADFIEMEKELFIELLTEIFNENLQLDNSANDEKSTYLDDFEAITVTSEISENYFPTTDQFIDYDSATEKIDYENAEDNEFINITTVSTRVIFPSIEITALEFDAFDHNKKFKNENINPEKEIFLVMPDELKFQSTTTAKPLIIWPQGHVSFPDTVENEKKISNFVHFIDLETGTEAAIETNDVLIQDILLENRDSEHSTMKPVVKWPQRLVNTYIPENDALESNNVQVLDVIETISKEIIDDNTNDLELSVATEEITEIKSEKEDTKFKDLETLNVLKLAMETVKILIPRNLQNTFTISRPLLD